MPPPLPHWGEIDPTDKDYQAKYDAQCTVIREYFLKNYDKAFTDMFAHMEPIHITIAEGAKPVNRFTCRRLSQELEAEAEEHLQELLHAGVIEECKESTVWCAPSIFVRILRRSPSSD